MNKELEQCLTQFINKALDVANKGIDTAGEQIPLILQEIIYWKVGISAFSIVSIVLIYIAMLFMMRKLYKYGCHKKNDYVDASIGIAIVSSVFSLFGFFIFAPDLIKALVAPRLVILEYLKGLL